MVRRPHWWFDSERDGGTALGLQCAHFHLERARSRSSHSNMAHVAGSAGQQCEPDRQLHAGATHVLVGGDGAICESPLFLLYPQQVAILLAVPAHANRGGGDRCGHLWCTRA
jgi:hypothetical protein